MVRSMTGYGRETAESANWKVTVEMKSVNNRFLDVTVKMPKQYNPLEDLIKKEISAVLSRGHVDAYITVEEVGERKQSIAVDTDLALDYCRAMQEIADKTGLPYQINLTDVASYYGVLTAQKEESDLDELWLTMGEAVKGSLKQLFDMRVTEGAKLAVDIQSRLDILAGIREKIMVRSPLVVSDYREKLSQRIQDVLGEVEIDQDKLLNEVAFFADKADIAEEITRLGSHFEQFLDNLAKDEPVGRKLDFILQEINREVNTIGSKANDTEISHLVIEAKGELEKIREQVQNFE
ncbi:MAG: YicC family protein [Firmicutes bacterium]|nr:YicC family protein [Bacillota bacterium]MBQ6811342.1 YicC family protein [Bacillota bacterium]